MKRNLDHTAAVDTRITGGGGGVSSPYYNSDSASEGSNSEECNLGCCMGGWINTMLGGDGNGNGGGGELFRDGGKAARNNKEDTANDLVVEELNKLSLKEREIVYEDLHGVSMVEDESNQEFVNKRLQEMKVEIEKIPRSKKVAYLIAMEEFGDIGKEFCQDESLHSMFLRADRWDSKKAAIRFVGWMDWKLELFGKEVLCHRHITLDKLQQDAKSTIQSGRLQILPQRDTSGRTIIFDWFGHQTDVPCSVKGMMQQFWYSLMATIEDDVQSQRMGIVYVFYTVGGSRFFSGDDKEVFFSCSRMAPMLPIRINSIHYCLNNPKLGPMIRFLQTGVGSHLRARFRSHEGNHTEVQYSLMTFGVPADVLPVADGKVKTTNVMKWYNRRKARDAALLNLVGGGRNKDFYGIDMPGRYDVMLGKGKPIQNSPGNRRLQELLKIYLDEYRAAKFGEKQYVAEKVLRLVKEPTPLPAATAEAAEISGRKDSSSSGDSSYYSIGRFGGGHPRFLKRRKDGWWEPVPDTVAIEKILHSFRAIRPSKTTTTTTVTSLGVANKSTTATSSKTTDGSTATTTTTTTTKRCKVEEESSIVMNGNNELQENIEQSSVIEDHFLDTIGKTDSELDLDSFKW